MKLNKFLYQKKLPVIFLNFATYQLSSSTFSHTINYGVLTQGVVKKTQGDGNLKKVEKH